MREKILIIDDDEELCEELAGILTDEGYEVATAFNGARGKQRLEANDYDLVILDLKLPKITGFDLLKFIKARSKESPKVMVLSGRPIDEQFWHIAEIYLSDEEKTLRTADAITTKPFNVEQLLQNIRNIFARL